MKGYLHRYIPVGYWQASNVSLFLIMLVCPILISFSAGEFLHVRGWVISNERPLSNAVLTVYENDSVVHRQRTGLRGTFYYNVPFNKEYIFSFTKDDLIAKKLYFNTHTGSAHDPERHYHFEFEVELLEDRTYIFSDFFNNPLAIIFYDSIHRQFDHVRYCIDDYIVNSQIVSRQSSVLSGYSPSFLLSHSGGVAQLVRNLDMLAANNFMQPPPNNLLADAEVERPVSSSAEISEVTSESMNSDIADRKPQNILSNITNPSPESQSITFFSLSDPGQEKIPESSVFFSVQVLATKKYIPRGFFDAINREMADSEILYYHDTDNLDKYIMGVFIRMDDTLEKFWKLRSLGYDAYIVAFQDEQRVRVSEARSVMGK